MNPPIDSNDSAQLGESIRSGVPTHAEPPAHCDLCADARFLAPGWQCNSCGRIGRLPSPGESSPPYDYAISHRTLALPVLTKPPLSVADAQRLHVCRFCQLDDTPSPGNPLVLHYGSEYAHRNCIAEANRLGNALPHAPATLRSPQDSGPCPNFGKPVWSLLCGCAADHLDHRLWCSTHAAARFGVPTHAET